jgi:glycosyltransferase involved in cell wall biosynthesis
VPPAGAARRHKITIVIPCYNERGTILELLRRVKGVMLDKFVVVVDNGSTDGTTDLLRSVCQGERALERDEHGSWVEGQRWMEGDGFVVVLQPKNLQKGASVRVGLALAESDYFICQDADLEYDPNDIPRLLDHAERTGDVAVFGSRLLHPSGLELSAFQLGRVGLTKLFDLLYGCDITDVSTCYKLLRTDVAKSLDLQSSGFDLDFEIPARLRKRKYTIAELPVRYSPRDHAGGKKIGWRHGVSAIWTLAKIRFER